MGNKPKLIIMSGVPGSGKSTVASLIAEGKSDWVIISADNFPGYYIEGSYKWSKEVCDLAHKYCRTIFTKFIDERKNIILDNTNLSERVRAFYINLAKSHDYDYTILTIVPEPKQIEEYAKRNKHNVTVDKIKKMAEDMAYDFIRGFIDVFKKRVS